MSSREEDKSVLWGQVQNKLKEIDPEFSHSKEQITRKCLNLRTTYKRIKQRFPSVTDSFFYLVFLFFFRKCLLFVHLTPVCHVLSSSSKFKFINIFFNTVVFVRS